MGANELVLGALKMDITIICLAILLFAGLYGIDNEN